MSDPIWRKRVNERLEAIDRIERKMGSLDKFLELAVIQDEKIAALELRVNALQNKIKESRKRPKKARSKQHPMGSTRRGKKS